tara:strand:- start:4 stop:150 length:147 start_codon:yes stop_codon:yes gene_type:complete
MAYKKETTRDPMYGESKIDGGKHKGPVELFPLPKKAKSNYSGKGPAPA